MIVILPVCRPDFHLAVQWLQWADALARYGEITSAYKLVVFCAQALTDEQRLRLRADAFTLQLEIAINPEAYERPELGYGAMANQQFRAGLEYAERFHPLDDVLWVEPDCIPMNPFWVDEIEEEYEWAGRPFMGDFHAIGRIPHMTGNSVYSRNWREIAPSIAALPGPNPSQGWDTSCAHETVPRSHRSSRIQQTWLVPIPKFTEDNIKMIHPGTSLYHRCKDGSLIDVLSKRLGIQIPKLGYPLCAPTPAVAGRSIYIPQRAGGTAIFIVSFARDIDMLDYLLKSLRKYARGFSGITIAVPTRDARQFQKLVREGVTLVTFDEPEGKGMLAHEIAKCRADEYCPDADYILHLDSDLIAWQPVTPSDFIEDGKCLLVREDYNLIEPRNPNRLIWRDCVERATGIISKFCYMVRHPNVYPIDLYRHTRAVVERHTGADFDEYVLSCENGFPQGFAEFPTLASVGMRDMPEKFNITDYWHELDAQANCVPTRDHQYIYLPGRDKFCEGWSHGGLGRYKRDWDRFLAGELPKHYLK